ncbi:MAG: hypothetical protein Q9191_003015 [Dirinaria sp. TL-2023a]
MPPPRGSAAYKKQDGTLALSKDNQYVSWTPVVPPGSQPVVTMPISSITNLQQTPASSPKVMLKIFAQAPGASAAETHTFSFTSQTTARAEADAIKDVLSKVIQASKSGGNPLAAAPSNASSAAMAIASAVSSGAQSGGDSNAWYDDSKLKADGELQQSLLKANPSLSKTFMESLRTKPDSISPSQFTAQFWSSRIHLLRAHAIERNQTRGQYNVLSTIRPMTVDNTTRLSISKEQIQLIFSQHSLVKRVYDENVPKLSEEAFWSRFFQSRLFKKLKGERITENDPPDPLLDKYLQHDEDAERSKRLMEAHIPHIIDIEGNEENHSQRKGNAPDWTMRPSNKVPIFRTLNTLSEKIMSHVTPNDVDPSLPIGVDEETFNSLALRDLQGDAGENQRILNIKDQSRFFASDKESGASEDALKYAKQKPAKVLSSLRSDLSQFKGNASLEAAIGVDPDSDSDDDETASKQGHVGSHSAISAATAQIMAAISQQQDQHDDLSASTTGFSTVESNSTYGLSSAIFDRLSLTHATTTEFLQHFWSIFLSGDASRADELSKLVETLDRAMDRIKAVANDAEAERKVEVDKLKKQARDYYERTKRKIQPDYDSVKGGAKVVNQLLGPTVKAIEVATGEYKKAVVEQTQEANGRR